jgi:hypothetical protein
MMEEQNIPPGMSEEQQAIDNRQSANEHFPEDTHAPQQEARDQQPVTKDMEVHHHAHAHGKKNWKAYFWEFLMLFLAVFCGFLAEYQLEHMIERDRAKELAKSFYEELKNDSVVVSQKVQNRIKQENALFELEKYFKDSSLTNISKTFQLNFLYGINFRTPAIFEPRTVVLEQLKNSGSLRYFKDQELQKLIGDLSVAIHNIADRQELEAQVRMQYINRLIIQHYDYDFESELTQNRQLDVFTATVEYENNSKMIPFHFKSLDKFDKVEMINLMGFYGRAAITSTRRIHYQKYIDLNAKLLMAFRKKYHLNE